MKIVIVGAGAAGLGIGWKLAEAGAEVVVLERAQPARAASWAAAGMIAPGAEAGETETAETSFAHYSSGLWPGFAADLEEKSGLAVRYRKSGSLICAASESEAAILRHGPGQFVTAPEARAMEPMLTASLSGALWLPDEAQVDNRALGRALAVAFAQAGGKLIVNEAVIRIETDGTRVFLVRTPFAVHEADAFVLAAGAWTGLLEGLPPQVLPPVSPVKGEMISLLAPEGAALPGRMIRGNGVYLVPRIKTLFVGATVADAGFDTSLTRQAEQSLFDAAVDLMPGLARWPVNEHWAGLRPGSPDGLPILGETAIKGLFAATGQFRNGILFAPAVAETLSALVMGRAPATDIKAFDPQRFART